MPTILDKHPCLSHPTLLRSSHIEPPTTAIHNKLRHKLRHKLHHKLKLKLKLKPNSNPNPNNKRTHNFSPICHTARLKLR
jgi:hypothetical protein